jgi:hypothetical protein
MTEGWNSNNIIEAEATTWAEIIKHKLKKKFGIEKKQED